MFDPEEKSPDEWVSDPHTRKLARLFHQLRTEAHGRLMDACERSADPEVRGSYERYAAARSFSLHLSGGKAGSRNDGT